MSVEPEVPNALLAVLARVSPLFEGRFEVRKFPLLDHPSEAGVRLVPSNPRAAWIELIFSVGSIYVSIEDKGSWESSELVPDEQAVEWASDLIERAAQFGFFLLRARGPKGLLVFGPRVPDSAEDLLGIRAGREGQIRESWEPW